MTGTNLTSKIFTRLARIDNARRVINPFFQLFGQELTTIAILTISSQRVLVNITSGMKSVKRAKGGIAPASRPDQSISQVFPWSNQMSLEEKDFVAKQ